MLRTTRTSGDASTGFTLLEILVVIGIIAALVAITVTVFGNIMDNARRTATTVTISKVDKLLQQQIDAWSREFRDSREIEQTAQHPHITDLVNGSHAREALALKLFYRQHFPQSVADASGFDGDPCTTGDNSSVYAAWLAQNWDCATDSLVNPEANLPTISSELLYLALTEGKVRGAAPVDADSFTGNEIADTDGDKFAEIVDGWGNPLRFYRWPTRLLNPFGLVASSLASPVNSTPPPLTSDSIAVASGTGSQFQNVLDHMVTGDMFIVLGREVMQLNSVSGDTLNVTRGAQSTDPEKHPSGALVKIAPFPDIVSLVFGSLNSSAVAHDADDPRGAILDSIRRKADPAAAASAFESKFHTLDSFHTPLIVSAGSDGVLGLYEASETENFGHLAAPDTSTDFSIVFDPLNSTLNDNLTNQMQGLGN